jgi:hypothetical protein
MILRIAYLKKTYEIPSEILNLKQESNEELKEKYKKIHEYVSTYKLNKVINRQTL